MCVVASECLRGRYTCTLVPLQIVTVSFVLCVQRQCKVQETQLKCTKARNDYLLNLVVANASIHNYYLHDLSALIDVSVLVWCGLIGTACKS